MSRRCGTVAPNHSAETPEESTSGPRARAPRPPAHVRGLDRESARGQGRPLQVRAVESHPECRRAAFTGLPYFPPDAALRFEGLDLAPYAGDEPSAFAIPTSDGQLRPAHRAGTFAFSAGGAPRSLTAYVLDGGNPDSLFVPFLDESSGTDTYGAGRYLDVEADEDGTYVLDFNLAYHPYCVYSPDFSCPLTPAENRLSTRIQAGERL